MPVTLKNPAMFVESYSLIQESRSAFWFVQSMRTLANHINDPLRLLVEIRYSRLGLKSSVRPDLHTLSGDVLVKEAFEGIDNAFHGSQDALLLELLVEDVCRYTSSYDARANGIERDAFFWQILAIAAHETNHAAENMLSASRCEHY